MSQKARNVRIICMLLALSFVLGGCSMQLDEDILSNEANYSVNISLPYATVTPPPAAKEDIQALVIDVQGGVTVNDEASILQDDVSSAGSSASSNYKSLRQGNTGLAVQALQTRLQELGYFTEGVSGIFDEATESAVRRFEQTYGTMQTGVATSDLQQRLFSSDAPSYLSDAYNKAVVAQYKVLERGDVGSSVYALQQRLQNLGYPMEELTGIFDSATAHAVELFYEEYGLTASDVANVALQKEIYSDSARPYSEAEITDIDNTATTAIGASIIEVQERLIQLGYMSGSADGSYNDRTQTAVKLFEEACGQLPSGVITSSLIKALSSKHAPSFDVLGSQYENLIEGASGEAVRDLQARLVALGFATGTPNGDYGEATTASMKLFQNQNGLEVNGVASVYAQAVLYSSFALNINGQNVMNLSYSQTGGSDEALDSTLRVGSNGNVVLRLQNRLTELGYITSITGTFDNLTSRAVSAFQEAVGVEPTGIAEASLLDFLYSDAAPNSASPFYKKIQDYQRLALNAKNSDVKELQTRLRRLKYLTSADIKGSSGTYNQATADAIAEIQALIGYENPDGIATAELQCFIFSDAGDLLKKSSAD